MFLQIKINLNNWKMFAIRPTFARRSGYAVILSYSIDLQVIHSVLELEKKLLEGHKGVYSKFEFQNT